VTESAGDRQNLHSDRNTTFVEDDVLGDDAAEPLDEFASDADETPADETSARRGREGLPAGFRMRHDAHYVEELTRSAPAIRQIAITEIDCDLGADEASSSIDALTESIRRAGILQPLLVAPADGRFRMIDGAKRLRAAALAGLPYVPCIVHDLDETAARQMRDSVNVREERAQPVEEPGQPLPAGLQVDLAESLELAEAQAAICARSAGNQKTRVAADVLQAELAHAARVARAAAIMLEAPRLRRGEVTARRIVERAALATSVARRLAGVRLETSVDDPEFRVPADARLVTQALAGSIDVMLALGEEVRRADMDESADTSALAENALLLRVSCVKTRPAIIIELTQRAASVEPELIGRFFDPSSTLHPGGPSGALLLAAAARIVRAHGGRADVRRDGPVGCTITFVLPQTSPRTAEL